jgi:hypothetical protein
MRLPFLVGTLLASVSFGASAPASDPLAWPEATAETKPWTRWWWPGSAVTKADVTADLEAIAAIGIGGVELTPVYGAKGYEDRYIDYLSPLWLEMLDHTMRETKRLGLGLDLAGGTGWNFGGPSVGDRDAPKHVAFRRFSVAPGQRLSEPVQLEQQPWVRYVLNQVYAVNPEASTALDHATGQAARSEPERVASMPLPPVSEIKDPLSANPNLQQLAIDQIKFRRDLPLQSLMGYGPAGEVVDLTARVGPDRRLDWTAPATGPGGGSWTLYAVFQAWNGKLVERAAPGGEGFMIDHLSDGATRRYLSQFDRAFAGRDLSALRGFFNDSYEVDDARHNSDWTDDFFNEFARRRGYDLRQHLPAFFGDPASDAHRRLLTDYRETIGELLLDRFTRDWTSWAHHYGKTTRHQAHGSPGNLLDLYAGTDIPETEGVSPPHIRFASSAANVSGRRLTGAEAVTFLNENFLSTPAQIRDNLRRYWLNGVNHVTYHGTAFSPQDEAWPGWFFYVAVHLNPRNSIWQHTSAVHDYASRVQSFLQAGEPDNDILLYFPIHDRYSEPAPRPLPAFEGDGPTRPLLDHFKSEGANLLQTPFGQVTSRLLSDGYAFDYVSDRQLQEAQVQDRVLRAGSGVRYQVILVPPTRQIPEATWRQLWQLAGQGATVVFVNGIPNDLPGWLDWEARQQRLRSAISSLRFAAAGPGVQRAALGDGQFLVGDDLSQLLAVARVPREVSVRHGLASIRRRDAHGVVYYLVNQADTPVDGWVELARPGAGAVMFDPSTGQRGRGVLQPAGAGAAVYLQLLPGESRLVRLTRELVAGEASPLWQAAGPSTSVSGSWQLKFLQGGPTRPVSQTLSSLQSWTELSGPDYARFSGTARYRITFPRPQANADAWWLDLGQVEETAEVWINGQRLGIVVGPTYRVLVPSRLLRDQNALEVQVANLSANRIADLDRRDPSWKKFYNQNIRPLFPANRDAAGMFSAAHWEPRPSGLFGPVSLTPLRQFSPAAKGE